MGLDAARGLALVAMMCVHILTVSYAATGRPTVTWILFPGDSPALFALLAGTGLALTSGGRRPLRGREMTAARAGIAVRALLLLILGLVIGHLGVILSPQVWNAVLGALAANPAASAAVAPALSAA